MKRHQSFRPDSMPQSENRHRCGFSLIEVIIATAILMGSVIVLARLAGMGRTMGQRAALHTEAQRLCEQTLCEIVLGLRSMEQVQRTVLQPADQRVMESGGYSEDAAQDRIVIRDRIAKWTYSVWITPVEDVRGLTLVTVRVESSDSGQPVQFRLRRWIRTDISEPPTTDFEGILASRSESFR
jgi:Prokaryotic N-terminal methylation motif